MAALLAAIGQHGYSILFACVFMETAGLPVPAALALITAGGLSAKGPLQPGWALSTALAAMLIGDTMMFLMGRHTGWWLLGVLCRVSLNPEACILRSAQTFHRRGRTLLLVAKFVPGINTMAPPMAGSMNMRFLPFLRLDFCGAALYIGVYFGMGYVFSDVLSSMTSRYESFGTILGWAIGLAILAYAGYRFSLWWKGRALTPIPLMAASEIARALYADPEPAIAVFDVRSHGYYSMEALRIKGSRRLDPNALPGEIENLPKEKEIVLYCTCIREATSSRVARILKEHGVRSSVIEGGLRSWKKAGLPLEKVPEEDVVNLPTF